MKRSLSTLGAFCALASVALAADLKSVVFIAGKPSHGPGEHEHNAGVQLLAKCLGQGAATLVTTKVHLNAEWPSLEELKGADTIVIYADGGPGHPALQDDHLQQLDAQMKRGCGLVCLHYAVEIPKEKGGPEFLKWLGGYFETDWSVNPTWDAKFDLPRSPITNGVKPFATHDEWYFHMRFPEGMQNVTPILGAVPPASTMDRPDGAHSGNPTVRAEVAAGKPQYVAWAVERPDGGRGFGFSGGHYHKNWALDDQRKLVLNAIVWTTKAQVPPDGIESKVTDADIAANQDNKPPRVPKPAATPAVPLAK